MPRKNNDDPRRPRNQDRPPHAGRPPRGERPGRPPARPRERAERPRSDEADRIAKVIARAGLCSRRDAEDWIAAGRVAVNGGVITSPALNVTPSDRITVDGEPLPQRERTRLFLYHKPRGLVTTNVDPEGRPTIFDRLPRHLPRLLTVGRLDIGTEGLLLLTNDGGLARVLELPDTGWLRRYRVRALGRVTQADLDKLRDGVTVEGIHYGPIEATLDREQGANVWLTFAIREGKNREVRNVLEHLGLQVNRLIRVSYGPFQVGELAEGEVEEVRTRVLREQLGEKVAEQANADFSSPVTDRPRDEGPRLAPPPQRQSRDDRDGGDSRRHGREGRERPRQEGFRGEGRQREGRQREQRPGDERSGGPGRFGDDRRHGGRRDERRDSGARAEKPGRFGGDRPHGGRRDERRDSGARAEKPGRFGDERRHGGRRDEHRDFGGRADKPGRFGDDRPHGGRRDERRDFGGRAEKPGRFGDERRHGGRRDERRDFGERPEKPEGRPRRGHAWRQDDAPLRRHYRGAGKEEHRPDRDAAAEKRAGLLTDRKGRRVLVERFGAEKKPAAEKPRGGGPSKPRGRPYRPDRSSGPRPSRPRH